MERIATHHPLVRSTRLRGVAATVREGMRFDLHKDSHGMWHCQCEFLDLDGVDRNAIAAIRMLAKHMENAKAMFSPISPDRLHGVMERRRNALAELGVFDEEA